MYSPRCSVTNFLGWFFNKHGYCQNVEECLYRHIDPVSRIGVCPWYERGFCPLGPDCSKRHVKGKRICQMFLTGFCPLGKECHDAQYVSRRRIYLLILVLIMKSQVSCRNGNRKNSFRYTSEEMSKIPWRHELHVCTIYFVCNMHFYHATSILLNSSFGFHNVGWYTRLEHCPSDDTPYQP